MLCFKMSAIRALWLLLPKPFKREDFYVMSQKLLTNNIKLDGYSDSSNTLFFVLCCILY